MTLDLALVLSVGCVGVSLAVKRMSASLVPAGESGATAPEPTLAALGRALDGFRWWVLAAPFCWLVAVWASGAALELGSEALEVVSGTAGVLPVVGLMASVGAGLWRFAMAAAATEAEDDLDAFLRDLQAWTLLAGSAGCWGLLLGALGRAALHAVGAP